LYKIIQYTGFLCMLFMLGCNGSKSTLPDLRESFAYTDTRPFGTSVSYSMLKNAYPSTYVNIVKQDVSLQYSLDDDKDALYFNISRNYFATDYASDLLMKFVKAGNTAFVSSAYFDSAFFAKIYCTQKSVGYQKSFFDYLEKTSAAMTEGLTLYNDTFSYYYKPFENSFPELNIDYARFIGVNTKGDPNMFVFFYGKGKFIFHNEPRALSNYFLLNKNNYLYMQSILKMLPAEPSKIYWDNYYPKLNYVSTSANKGSLWDSIKNSPGLLAAFFIILGLFLFYLIFNSKRKQRIVPVKKQTENTSIAFAQAIAGLYLTKKENKDVVEKMITYFNEHIRTKYFFTTNINDKDYASALSRKSGVPYELTNELTNTILQSYARTKITDQELLNLNALIEKFLKHKN
jgi:hypothetical protein